LFYKKCTQHTAIFEIDRTQIEGQALYRYLKSSAYARLIKQVSIREKKYNFDDLNESIKTAFADADSRITHKTKNVDDLFEQLGI
jgi:stalled ribosome rescue protein Dom34